MGKCKMNHTGVDRRFFNKLLSLIPFIKINFAKNSIKETEPVFEVREYHKPKISILYNVLKSGTSWNTIRDKLWNGGRVKYRKMDTEDIEISSCVTKIYDETPRGLKWKDRKNWTKK